jgi:hypothetical protein
MSQSKISRRAAMAALPIAAAGASLATLPAIAEPISTAITPPVVPSRHSITRLYAHFEKAVASCAAFPKNDGSPGHDARFGKTVDVATRIGNRIIATPATSIDEMLLRIRVVGWCEGICDDLASLDNWSANRLHDTEALHALISLRAELRAIRDAFGPVGNPLIIPYSVTVADYASLEERSDARDIVEAALGNAARTMKRGQS